MNRIFRIVWNRALGQFVVASELVRSRRATGGATVVGPLRSGWTRGLLFAALAAVMPLSHAHTTSVGYIAPLGSSNTITFWYGTYHADVTLGQFEGQFKLVGDNGFSQTVDFTQIVGTGQTNTQAPVGLEDGVNNFYAESESGTKLVATPPSNGPSLVWQGVTFTGLAAGTYTYTYIPAASPTVQWQPWNPVLSNTLVVTAADLNGFPMLPGETYTQDDPELNQADSIVFNGGIFAPTDDSTKSQPVTVRSGGGTVDTTGGDVTFDGGIDGTGLLTKTGDGTLTIEGDNTSTGGLAINGGTVKVGSDSALGDPDAGLSFDGGTLNTTGDIDNGRDVTLNSGGGTFDTDAGTTLTNSGVISGSGDLTKEGDGTLALTGDNTFTGDLNINDGTVQVSSDNNVGTGTVNIGDGTLQATGDFNIDNAVTLTDANSTVDTQDNDATLSGPVDGSGALNKEGSGTLTLEGNNTFSGGLNINDGTVQVSDADNLGAGTVTIGDATLQATGSFDADNAIELTDADSTIDTQNNDVGLTGDIGGSGALNKEGGGTLTLEGDNTFSGGLNINDGTVQVSDDSNLGSGKVTIDDGTLQATDSFDTDNAITLTDADSTIDTQSHDVGVSGDIDGSGALNKDGSGTLTLTGDNTFSGGLNINDGTVQVSDDSNLGSGAVTIGDGTLQATDSFDTDNAITLTDTGSTIDAQGHDVKLTGDIDGSGTLNKEGSGTLTVDGVASQSGGTVVNDGTLVLGGDNTYTGGTTINGGTLQIDNDKNLGDASGGLTFNGGTLHTTGDVDSDRDITLAGNGTIVSDAGTTMTNSGDVDGSGTLVKDGTGKLELGGELSQTGGTVVNDGTLVLGGDNSYTGGTTLNGGTLQINNDKNLGDTSSDLTFNGGTLHTTGNVDSQRDITLSGDGTFVGDAGTTMTSAGDISGSGDLVKKGAGKLVLEGNNSYTGETAIDGGTLALSGAGSLASSSKVVNNGTLDISGTSAGADVTALVGTGNVQLGSQTLTITDAAGDFGGAIAGTGAVVIDHGTQTLSGNNTFSGGVQVNNGTLKVAKDQNLGNGPVTIGNGGVLQSTGSFTSDNAVVLKGPGSTIDTHGSDVVLSGQVSGAGTLNKVGDGTLTLTGNNSQNGIHIKGGTLAFDGDAALGASTGVVTIEDDTTLRTLSDVNITHAIYVNDTRSAVFDTGNHAVTVSGNIDGAGIVQKLGAGVLTLSGNNSQVLMEVKGGSIAVASQGAAGAAGGDIYIGTDGSFTTLFGGTITQKVHVTGENARFDTNGHDVTLSGTIDGNACFIKSGDGRLDLRGGGSNDIGACIQQGDLAFNSTFNGRVWVYEGATASGSGRIVGDVDVKGTLSPGNSPGHLEVYGSVTQQKGSRLLVDVDGHTAGVGAGHFDTLELVGADSVYTAGGELAPRLRGITGDASNTYQPQIGDTFAVVHAEGGVEGAYETVAQPTDGLPDNARFDVYYTADDVVLAVTADSYAKLLSGASTVNAASVGAAVDGVRGAAGARFGGAGRLQGELLGMDTERLSHTFQQLGGEVHADLMSAVAQSGYRLQSTVRQRMDSPANGDVQGAGAAVDADLGDHFWVTTIHANGSLDASATAQGYGFNNNALLVGLDNAVSDHFTAGGGVAYSRDAVYAGWLGEGKHSSYQVFGYGVWQSGGMYVNGIVGYGQDQYTIDRAVDLGSGTAQLSSSPNGHTLALDIEAGKRFELGGWALTPAIGVSSQDLRRDGTSEHGDGAVALAMDHGDVTSVRARLGGRLSTSFALSTWNISPHLDVFAVNEMGDTSAALTSRLDGTGRFTTRASSPGRNGLQVGAGVVANLDTNATLYLDYQSDHWSHATSHEFKAGVRIAF